MMNASVLVILINDIRNLYLISKLLLLVLVVFLLFCCCFVVVVVKRLWIKIRSLLNLGFSFFDKELGYINRAIESSRNYKLVSLKRACISVILFPTANAKTNKDSKVQLKIQGKSWNSTDKHNSENFSIDKENWCKGLLSPIKNKALMKIIKSTGTHNYSKYMKKKSS